MKRSFTNILSNDIEKTAGFYEKLLGMTRHFDSDWFVILTHPGIPGLEFGILQKDHETVPEAARTAAGGTIITFVVDDCDKVHGIAKELNADIIAEPTDMPYGQRRLLVRDPDGTIVDVSAPTAPITEN